MDNPNVEFTRDVAGALKERAEAQSMMAKHASAQREAMQEACLGALRKALPGASAETCLREAANWDVGDARTGRSWRARQVSKKSKEEQEEQRAGGNEEERKRRFSWSGNEGTRSTSERRTCA